MQNVFEKPFLKIINSLPKWIKNPIIIIVFLISFFIVVVQTINLLFPKNKTEETEEIDKTNKTENNTINNNYDYRSTNPNEPEIINVDNAKKTKNNSINIIYENLDETTENLLKDKLTLLQFNNSLNNTKLSISKSNGLTFVLTSENDSVLFFKSGVNPDYGHILKEIINDINTL